jgi:hypothetical protein
MSESRPPTGPRAPSFQVRVPLEWSDDEVPIVYANQVLVSHGGPEFFVVFGLLIPPSNPDHIPDVYTIRQQVKVVISREAMPSIVAALNDNLRRYQEALARAATSRAPDEEAESGPSQDPQGGP